MRWIPRNATLVHHLLRKPREPPARREKNMSDPQGGSPLPQVPSTSLRTYGGADTGVRRDDAQLCIDVRMALLRTCPTLAYGVEISARDGVVHLRGSVGSVGTLVRMYRAARRVDGIQWVCNDVTVLARA
jgi:hypothetical protein